MISLVEFKKLLGEQALSMSDEDVENLRKAQYELAYILFDKWNKDRFHSN
jgi:hypothetical protein